MKVAVLGASGLIGKPITQILVENSVSTLGVSKQNQLNFSKNYEHCLTDLASISVDMLVETLFDCDVIINAVGRVKQRIRESNLEEKIDAFLLNTVLPQILSFAFSGSNKQIFTITTDCVFDGAEGYYSELSQHNATDTYGISKSCGEVVSKNVYNLRCSVIGPDSTDRSLVGWLQNQFSCAEVSGYTDHLWNGLTTTALAQVIFGLVKDYDSGLKAGTQHIVPSGFATKAELVHALVNILNRKDIFVRDHPSGRPINRVLTTMNASTNARLWHGANFEAVPTVQDLISEENFIRAFVSASPNQ